MIGLWETRFEELAIFNSEKDKTKFAAEYLQKMQNLQEDYFKKMKVLANAYGWVVL
jgi:hypothetical protein